MRKLYIISGTLTTIIILIVTAILVSAEPPNTPFDYIEGDSDDADFVSSVQVVEGYDGDFSELSLITEEEAEGRASSYADGAQVIGTELEAEGTNVIYNVEVKFEGNEFEIIVDAGNGEVFGAFYETESLWESWFDD